METDIQDYVKKRHIYSYSPSNQGRKIDSKQTSE